MFRNKDGTIQVIGSISIVAGWFFASRGWVPMNYFASAIGCGLWTVAGIMRSDMQIVVLDTIVTVLSLISILTFFTNNGTLLPTP